MIYKICQLLYESCQMPYKYCEIIYISCQLLYKSDQMLYRSCDNATCYKNVVNCYIKVVKWYWVLTQIRFKQYVTLKESMFSTSTPQTSTTGWKGYLCPEYVCSSHAISELEQVALDSSQIGFRPKNPLRNEFCFEYWMKILRSVAELILINDAQNNGHLLLLPAYFHSLSLTHHFTCIMLSWNQAWWNTFPV